MDEQLQKIMPEMKSPALPSKTDDVLPGAPKVSGVELGSSSAFELSENGLDKARLGTTVPVLVSANGDTINVPIEDMHRAPGKKDAWVAGTPSYLSAAKETPSAPKNSVKQSHTGVELKETPKQSSVSVEQGSGITPLNFTPQKLEAFLKKANKALNGLDDTHPLKRASFTMRQVKVQGVPVWRVFLRHGNRTNYFTLTTEQKSWNYANYKKISSVPHVIEWAERRAGKVAQK